jgi:hypothetical protein
MPRRAQAISVHSVPAELRSQRLRGQDAAGKLAQLGLMQVVPFIMHSLAWHNVALLSNVTQRRARQTPETT